MYINEKKYGESPTESLSYKFSIFINLYIKVEIPQHTVHTAFPIMLKFMILDYYHFNCQGIGLTMQ